MIVLLGLLSFPSALSAANITQDIDGLRYTLDPTTKTASVELLDNTITKAVIRDCVDYEKTEYKVTSVSKSFKSSTIKELTLGKYLVDITYGAFTWCNNLLRVNYNTENWSNQSSECPFPNSLSEVIFGEGVKTIPTNAFSGCKNISSINLPNSLVTILNNAFRDCGGLKSITIPESVTSIGNFAFELCTGLTSVTLSKNLTHIGEGAFMLCYKISEITFPDSLTTLSGSLLWCCEGLKKVVLPGRLTQIGVKTFEGCENLVDIKLPSSLQKIGDEAFAACWSLKDITIPDSVTSIGKGAFNECTGLTWLTLPKNLTFIGDEAFSLCDSLEEVEIPNSVTSIGNGAFKGCAGLTWLTLPKNLTFIGDGAFMGCKRLAEVSLPNGITSLNDKVFSGCTNLVHISLPANLESIGKSTFSSCGFTSINLPKTLKTIGSSAFWGLDLPEIDLPESVVSIGEGAFAYNKSLRSITLPPLLDAISNSTFNNCAELEEVVIGSNVKEIGNEAFNACSKLTKINFPDKLTSIGEKAFYQCTSLPEAVLPNSVAHIGRLAFNRCTNLRKVNIPSSLTEIDYSVFSSCSAISSIVIPEGLTKIGESAFSSCSSLRSLSLPSSLKSIGTKAFQGCSFSEVKLPDALEEIGEEAFGRNNYLTSIKIPSSVQSFGESAFTTCRNLKTAWIEAQSIPQSAFEQCSDLESLCLNTSRIGAAFGTCDAIRQIYSLTENAPRAVSSSFSNYDNVILWVPIGASENYKNATVWKNFTNIQESDFADLDKIFNPDYKPVLPETVTVDGIIYSLNHETKTASVRGAETVIENVVIHGTVNVEGYDYAVKSINDEAFTGASIKTLTVEEGVQSIGFNAFKDCSAISDIILPASLTVIGDNAFQNDEGIINVRIADVNKWAQIEFGSTDNNSLTCNPIVYSKHLYIGDSTDPVKHLLIENVKNISALSFAGASELKTVKITGNESIGRYAFANLMSLESLCLETTSIATGNFISGYACNVYSLTATPPAIEDSWVFNQYASNSTLYVPKGCVAAYRDAYKWQDFGQIVESDFNNLDDIFNPSDDPEEPEVLEQIWVGELCYSLYPGTRTATVTGSYSQNDTISVPAFISFDDTEYTVTEIGDYAFQLTSYKHITIPETITKIGYASFNACILESFIIPDSVTEIGEGAFQTCELLKTVHIGKGIENLPDFAFSDCGFDSLKLPENVKTIGRYCFSCCMQLVSVDTNAVIEIGKEAFGQCNALKEVIIGPVTKKIGEFAFNVCPALEKVNFNAINCADIEWSPLSTSISEIVFGEKVERIPANLCYGCSNLTKVTIPDNVKEIGEYAFYSCDQLKELTIGTGVERIGNSAFDGCSNIATVNFNAINCADFETYPLPTSISEIVFGEKVERIPANLCYGCSNLTKLTIPDNVTEIGKYAFYYCDQLKELTIGKGVERIEYTAFDGCSNIATLNFNAVDCADLLSYSDDGSLVYTQGFSPNVTEVNFGGDIRRIPGGLLARNESLTEIEIPASVEEIGGYVFYDCKGLTNVVLNDIENWAQVDLDNAYSNPIVYSLTFTLKDEDNPVQHLDLRNIDEVKIGTFYNARNLKTVRIRDIESVGMDAFAGCNGLTDICIEVKHLDDDAFWVFNKNLNVYSLTQMPPAYDQSPFYLFYEDLTLHDVTLYVPIGCKEVYGADPFWGQLNIIESEMTDLDKIFDPDYFVLNVGSIMNSDEAMFFTLDGIRVDGERLAPGTYIRILNGKTTKILVK